MRSFGESFSFAVFISAACMTGAVALAAMLRPHAPKRELFFSSPIETVGSPLEE
jgi:hypothetical protein